MTNQYVARPTHDFQCPSVFCVIQCQFHVLFDPINYAQHTVQIQYRTRNPYKQASVRGGKVSAISVMIP